MRTTQALVLAGISLLSTGCSSKQVQLYAQKLQAYLTEYRAGVKSQLEAEQRVYDQMSTIFATEAERDVYEGLKLERLRQQRLVTADLADGRLQPSQVTEKMRETAIHEFETSKAWFEQELTVQRQYQSGLAKLAVDAKKLTALDSALKAIEKNADLKTALTDVTNQGKAFQNEFRLQGCKDMERSIAITAGSVTELKARKAAAEAAKLTTEAEAIDAQITALTAAQAATQTALESNTSFKADAKKCQ